jgi:hypothetical protein
MIVINPPKRIEGEETTRFQAHVERDRGRSSLPRNLWYEVPKHTGDSIEPGMAPFVLPLLHLAMELGEPLIVRGALSQRLQDGIRDYQDTFHAWLPGRFQKIEVRCETRRTEQQPTRGDVEMSAFSGGVDSFYSLWCSTNRVNAVHRISHGLFVHGFDIPLADRSSFEVAAAAYGPLLRRLGVDLLVLRTNIREFRVDWEYAHGAALAAAAHLLVPLVANFIIPSSKSSGTLCPWGSDPRVDSLLSDDQLDIVHDDTTLNRLDKLRAMAGWWPLAEHLRVCWENPNGLLNCCRCNDCNFTMIELDVLGVLADIKTFQLPPRTSDYRRLHYVTRHEREVGRSLIEEARQRGRRDIARLVDDGMRRSLRVRWVRRVLQDPLRRLVRRLRLANL